MKTVLTILFSLLLALGQTAFMASAAPPVCAAKSCAKCACAKPGCCVERSTPAGPASPLAVPVSTPSVHWQLAILTSLGLLPPLPATPMVVPSSAASFLPPNAGPLHERNCVWLI